MRTSSTSRHLIVSTTSGSGFTAALFVRDRFGLPFAEDVPRLAPAVARNPPSLTPPISPAAWDAWWGALIEAEAGSLVVPRDPTLADLLELVRDDAQTWGQTEADAAAIAYRPTWLPPLLDVSEGSGRHDTEIVPVSGTWVVPVNDRRILVSTESYSDHSAMDTLWRARIGALVGA